MLDRSTKRKKSLLLLMVVIILGVAVSPAAAQEWLQFDELLIELWPEYDQPDVLVIYRAVLSSNVSLPVEVSFQIPVEAGQPHAVAFRDEQGQLMSVQFERIVRGDLAEISFLSPSREIQFEYYHPGLEMEGDLRSFTFQWQDDHLIQQAAVQVQQPRGASEMSIRPPLETSFEASDGLTYYFGTLPSLKSGKLTLQLSYQKGNDRLSAANAPVQPGAPIEPEITFSLRGRDVIPWIVGGVGLLAIFSAVLLYWQSERGDSPLHLPRAFLKEDSAERENNFCPKCGSRTGEDDRFCRVCGSKLS